jgi:hypothetical protein
MKTKLTGIPEISTNGAKSTIGIGISKKFIPFIPYAGVMMGTTSAAGVNVTSLDLTIGSAIAWSKQGAVFVEYTNQGLSAAGVNYTSGQIALGVGYTI